jgi:exopolysaccharide biosynthesis protein
VRVDLTNPHLTFETEPGRDSLFHGETVPEVVKREAATTRARVLAAVNGDFWAMSPRPYTPLGLLVANNMICNMPARERSTLVITRERKVHIGPVELSVVLRAGKQNIAVGAINDLRASRSAVLFTPPLGRDIPPSAGKRYHVKLPGAEFLPNQSYKVQVTSIDGSTTTSLTSDTLVLSLPAGALEIGTSDATLAASMPQVQGEVIACVGGGPRILHKGKVQVDFESEGIGRSFSYDRHPRTAVGVTADGRAMYLVAVDGRQPKLSVGQNLFELAEYLRKLGCAEAINLDGGGSTTMVVDGAVVNHPSDLKGPRPVSNSLLVLAQPGSGKPHSLTFQPSGSPLIVPAGTSLHLDIKAFDETGAPVPVDSAAPIEATVANIAKHTKAGSGGVDLELSETPGTGHVQARLEGATGELDLRVDQLPKIASSPAYLLLDTGETQQLDVQFPSATGFTVQPQMIRLSASEDSVTCTQLNVSGQHRGHGLLTVAVGTRTQTVPYFVDEATTTGLASFDSAERHLALAGRNYDGNQTAVQAVTTDHVEGRGALGVTYAMNGRGRSAIHIPIQAVLNTEPTKFSIAIRGDGKEAWLRANLVDSRGTTFTADFTEGGKGIYWKDEWRRRTCLYKDLVSDSSAPGAAPQLPLTFKELYIAQDQEVLKTSGRILLDDLQAQYPPANAK